MRKILKALLQNVKAPTFAVTCPFSHNDDSTFLVNVSLKQKQFLTFASPHRVCRVSMVKIVKPRPDSRGSSEHKYLVS